MKNFIKRNMYNMFFSVVLILSIGFLMILKYKIAYISDRNLSIKKELQSIWIYNNVFILILLLISIMFVYYLRKDILNFSEKIAYIINNIMLKNYNIDFQTNEETILSKVENMFKHLVDIMKDREEKYKTEKDSIKSLISDISHQIKTPIANIIMYNDTLIERNLDENEKNLFLKNMKNQTNKLEWLVQSLIKMSRLENNIIKLNLIEYEISETIADALSNIYLKTEKKNIDIKVDCDQSIKAIYDPKWTSEAIFNILDNAVKYTNSGGKIEINVESWQIFSKIDIIDSGIGIDEEEINNIFKRFYRVKSVNIVDGVGIGLYLSRKIISMEGGYMKVSSKKGIGSTFSIFLPNSV